VQKQNKSPEGKVRDCRRG